MAYFLNKIIETTGSAAVPETAGCCPTLVLCFCHEKRVSAGREARE